MTKTIKFAVDSDDQFSVNSIPLRRGITAHTCTSEMPAIIRRLGEGQGLLLNSSNATLTVGFFLIDKDEQVGAKHWMIRPGEFVEIGCGPGVEWRVTC